MSVQRLCYLVFGFMLAVTTACGKPSEKNLCEDVECALGVCDGGTGECVNPASCAEDAPCLAGHECVESQCVATFSCDAESACDRGVCESGACVNPARCDGDADCVSGFACDDDVCVEDACDQVTCDRGVCEKDSGECVNAAVCTAETQDVDCLEGSVCYNQTCELESVVCDDIACSRGACSLETLDCVNSEDCGGDDRNCLDGYVCGDANTCIQNICEANMVDCVRGVCDVATGTCQNGETCDELTDCRDGFFCIDAACVEMDTACEVCPGNTVCGYDDQNVAVACDENPAGCNNAIDCVGDRVCQDGACADPAPCVPDAFETNDALADATAWFANATDGGITANICDGDADFFSYDLAQDPEFTGTLVAQVVIAGSDVGIGPLTLELYDPAGTVVATNTSQIDDSSVRVEFTIGNINQGVYTLAVRDGGGAGIGGIGYTVYMDLVDATAATACNAAQQAVTGVMGDTSLSQSNTLGSDCVNQAAGNEEAWILDVPQDSYVTIDVTGAQFDAVISLRRQCEVDASEIACANDGGPRVRETVATALQAGQYSLVIQGAAGSESGTYGLQINQEPIVCTAAGNTCIDATSASVCNARGTGFDTVACDAGCDMATNACIREPADVCATAIDATGGYLGSLPLGFLKNDYDPGPTCVPTGGFGSSVTDGPDAVFSVTLQDGDVMYATADPSGFDYIGVYLVDDCGDVSSSCIDGSNDADFSGTEVFSFENTTGAAKDYFFVVDAEAGATGSVEVEIAVGPRLCTPGMTQCNGTFLETCADSGLSYDQRACTSGCDPMTVACVPPPNDMCAGAIDVSAGGTWTESVDEFNNNYSNSRSCTGFSANGPEGVYVLTGTPGQIATITLTASYDASLYAAEDCGDVAFTCLAGSDSGGSGTAETIELRIDDTDPIYIFADAFSSSANGQYTLDVSFRAPDCSNFEQAVACQADMMTLQYCNATGTLEDYACATTCAGAACDAPSGDRCFDAVVLAHQGTFTGRFDDFNEDYSPGVGTCILSSGNRQRGPDATFAVDLVAGDLLTATIDTTDSQGSLWIMTDCANPRDSCVAAAPRQKELQHYAQTTGRYYVVVDSTSSFSSSQFILDIDIQSGFACQPGGASCDETSGTVTQCDATGTAVTGFINCPNGCRPSGQCNGPSPAPDACPSAFVVNGSVSFLDNYGRFTDVFDPAASMTNTCGLSDTDGPDAVYQVTLGPNDVVDVKVDDLSGSGSPRVYIATDCADVGTSCVASDSDFEAVRAAHISTLGETVYVIVDSSSSSVKDPFTVDIDVRPAQCIPGSAQCTGSNTGESCNEYAELESFDCYFGCANGTCNAPTNDSCAMPVDVTAGGTTTIPIDGYTDTYNPGFNGCTDYDADGPDGTFKLSLAQDQVVTVTATAEDFDVSLYLTTTCDDVATCAVGRDDGFSGSESFTYRAPAAGDYFVHVDTSSSSPTGDYSLTIDYPATICTPGGTACDVAGQNIEACNDFGTQSETIACDMQGCVTGQSLCTNTDGETCAAAIDANAGGMFTGNYANFGNDYSLDSTTSCTNWSSDGSEAVYYVDLTANQQLTATLSSPSADTSLWITSICGGAVDSCLVGEDSFGTETVTYTAPADQRIFIFADSYSSSTDDFTLNVTIQ